MYLEYEGTRYRGWQFQKKLPTVFTRGMTLLRGVIYIRYRDGVLRFVGMKDFKSFTAAKPDEQSTKVLIDECVIIKVKQEYPVYSRFFL